MNQKVIDFLIEKPSYLKEAKRIVADKFNTTIEEVTEAFKYVRGLNKAFEYAGGLSNLNTNNNTNDYEEFLDSAGIQKDKVKSTKYWQTQDGAVRYSVVTKEENLELPNLDEVIHTLGAVVRPIEYKTKYEESNKVLCVYTSDKHTGSKLGENALYDNEYNAQVLSDRMSAVLGDIYKSYKKEGKFDNLIICDLGDALDGYNGFTTRGGHALPQNMSNKEAFNAYIDIHKRFYRAIAELDVANFIEIYHLTDSNHGGEFDYFANKCLQEYMRLAFPKINFNICEKFLNVVEQDWFTLILTHGKDERDMKNGLPLNLDPKTESYLLDYAISEKLDLSNLHVIKGDLHQSSSYQSKHFRYKNIPSIYGASKWIQTNYGNTKPGCSFDIFEKDKLTSSWDLWF